MKIQTYHRSSKTITAPECSSNLKLVFRCWVCKAIGCDDELVDFYCGPSEDGDFVALWLVSNFDPPESLVPQAVAWTRNGNLPAYHWAQLLKGYWSAERDHNDCEEPNCSKVEHIEGSLMSPDEVEQVALSVWPDLKHL
jgi:hypothetical protein